MLRGDRPGGGDHAAGSARNRPAVAVHAAVPDDWATFFPAARSMKVPPNTVLVEAHELTDAVVFLLSGLVHLVSRSRDGRERVVGWREAGAILGGVAALAASRAIAGGAGWPLN